MNPKDRDRVRSLYENTFAIFGNDARSVHWSSKENQEIRFEVLSKIADLNNKRILDIGCGLGDLYKFFITKQISVDYTGVDIVPAFIERAKERFPDAHFILNDAEHTQGSYDYILASGIFNTTTSESKASAFATITHIFKHSTQGFAFNMLDASAHPSDETLVAYDPHEVVAFCKTLTPHVILVHDYLTWDFTIYLYH